MTKLLAADCKRMIYHFLRLAMIRLAYTDEGKATSQRCLSRAFVNFGGEDKVRVQNIMDFEKMIGKKIDSAMFSNNWDREGVTFPEIFYRNNGIPCHYEISASKPLG